MLSLNPITRKSLRDLLELALKMQQDRDLQNLLITIHKLQAIWEISNKKSFFMPSWIKLQNNQIMDNAFNEIGITKMGSTAGIVLEGQLQGKLTGTEVEDLRSQHPVDLEEMEHIAGSVDLETCSSIIDEMDLEETDRFEEQNKEYFNRLNDANQDDENVKKQNNEKFAEEELEAAEVMEGMIEEEIQMSMHTSASWWKKFL